MIIKVVTHLLTVTLPVVVIESAFHYYLWIGIYCQSPLGTDTNLQVVVENFFLPLHQGMNLLSEAECL